MSPTWTFGTKYHFFSVSTPIFEAPLFIKSPYSSCKDLRGLSIPSNILLIIPGPKLKLKVLLRLLHLDQFLIPLFPHIPEL